jgi:hypothetical protein
MAVEKPQKKAAAQKHDVQPAASKETMLRELILLFEGANNAGRRILQQIIGGAIVRQNPGMTSDQQSALQRELEAFIAERAGTDFVSQLMAVYDRTYTTSEVADLLKFYRSPTGRKSLTVAPQLGRDSMEFAQRYAQSILPEFEPRFAKVMQTHSAPAPGVTN